MTYGHRRSPDDDATPSFLFGDAGPKAPLLAGGASPMLEMFKGCLPPIEIIPDEILTVILEFACLCSDDPIHLFRDLLLAVCRKWRKIVLHTSSFWSVLHLSPSINAGDLLRYLDMHLERSKGYPLDIHLRCYWHPTIIKVILDRIIPHNERWRRLVIETPTDDIFSLLANVPGPSLEVVKICYFLREKASQGPPSTFPMSNLSSLSSLSLQNMSLGSKAPFMPQLRKVKLRGTTTWSSYFDLCDVLGRSPVLETLTLQLKATGSSSENRAPISLSALRHCDIITSEGLSHNISKLLRQLRCPNLVSITVQDIGLRAEREILMRFNKPSDKPSNISPPGTITGDVHPSKLYVRSSDLYLAWNALTPRPSLTELELRAPQWPAHHQLEELCSGLTTLEVLILREFDTSSALQDIGAGPAVVIPSLQTLDVEFKHTKYSEDHHVSQFFRILSLPHLRSLRFRNLLSKEWENLLYSSYYPSLRSLSLLDMRDFVSSTADPTTTFPFITELHLSNVRSNDFVRRLLQDRTWPKLQSMTIVGDDLISKPLLHKMVVARCEAGLRISNLVLEELHVNGDSRNWLNRHCCVHYLHSQN